MAKPTDAQRQEALRVEWRTFGPLMVAMALCLLAAFQHLNTGDEWSGWQFWVPTALFYLIFLISEVHLRRVVKRMK